MRTNVLGNFKASFETWSTLKWENFEWDISCFSKKIQVCIDFIIDCFLHIVAQIQIWLFFVINKWIEKLFMWNPAEMGSYQHLDLINNQSEKHKKGSKRPMIWKSIRPTFQNNIVSALVTISFVIIWVIEVNFWQSVSERSLCLSASAH